MMLCVKAEICQMVFQVLTAPQLKTPGQLLCCVHVVEMR